MITYKEFRPTPYDRHLYIDEDREDWLVTRFIQTRDSGCYEQSNFATALKMLGGEQDGLVEVHRFGHWGPGWFEIILVHSSMENKVREIEEKFDNYPVLDEEDLTERELAAINDAWWYMHLREKIEFAKRNGHSIFAARRTAWDCNNNAGDAVYELIER